MHHSKNLFVLSTLALSISAYANNAPNASTISREVDEVSTMPNLAPQAVQSQPQSARAAQDSDAIEIDVSKIQLSGVQSVDPSAFAEIIRPLEGKRATLGELRDLADQITLYYQRQGYFLAKAVLPAQRIENGVVAVQVIEGKVASVQLNNQSRLKDDTVKAYLRGIALNQPLNNQQSERALLLLRDLAGAGEVNYSLDAGETVGETNIIANLSQAPLLRGSLSLDNHGSESTGEKRIRANLSLQSPFGRGETLNLQGMTSLKGLDYGRIGLELPLGYDGLSFNTSLSRTRYELGGAFSLLEADGSSDSVDFGLKYPLLRTNAHNIWLAAGGEFRRLKDSVHSTNTETVKAVRSGQLSLNGTFQDGFLNGGYTAINLQNTFGRLNIRSAEAREIDALSAKTAGGYYKLHLNLSRTQYLSERWSLWGNLSAQWANKNLDSGEQLSLGGLDAVSAYTSNAASGDIGVIGNMQIRYALNPYLTLSGFYDVGRVKLRSKPYLNEKNHRSLQGAGVGLNVQVKQFMLEAKSAWQINAPNSEKGKQPKVWLKLSYHF